MATADVDSDDLATATAALARCDWDAARVMFERAIDRGAGPEALEGLAGGYRIETEWRYVTARA